MAGLRQITRLFTRRSILPKCSMVIASGHCGLEGMETFMSLADVLATRVTE